MDGSIVYPSQKLVVDNTGITNDADNAYPEVVINSIKVANYVSTENTPNSGYWWAIEAKSINIYGYNFVLQNAQRCGGGTSPIYTRQKTQNEWSEWTLMGDTQ